MFPGRKSGFAFMDGQITSQTVYLSVFSFSASLH